MKIPQQRPQNADCDGSSQECVILHVIAVDVAAHDLSELYAPPRLTIHSVFPAFDLVRLLIWWTDLRGRMPPGRFQEKHLVGNIFVSFAMSVCKLQHSHGLFLT